MKETIKHTTVKGRVKVLRASLYKDHKIIVRMIGDDYFEYITECNGEKYSSYIIIIPEEGKKKLTKSQINGCIEMVSAGAEATIDALMGIDISEEDKKKVELFEETMRKVENAKEN